MIRSQLVKLYACLAFVAWGHLCVGQGTAFTTDDPVSYNNYVVQEQNKVTQSYMGFLNMLLSDADFKVVEQERVRVVEQLELSLRRLRNMAPFRGSVAWRDECVAVFNEYKEIFGGEYAKVAALMGTQSGTLAQVEAFYALEVKTEKRLQACTVRLLKGQKEFAQQHKMALTPNPYQKHADRILAASIYTREVMLGYVAVAKPNEAWWDAMEKDDAAGMEKARLAILAAAKESKLGEMPLFEGDGALRDLGIKRVRYYEGLAGKDYVEMGRILGSAERTAADVSRVNGMIESYNNENMAQNGAFNAVSLELMRRVVNSDQ